MLPLRKLYNFLMKNSLLIFLSVLIYGCSASSVTKKQIRYFDENNNEISKRQFKQIRSTLKFLSIPGDSINHKKLVKREVRGQINDINALKTLSENATNRNLPTQKPIVIIYHPGKDQCNKTGISSLSMKIWYTELELGIKQIAPVKPIYICKDEDAVEKNDKDLNWTKDPESTIERLFFKHHYPCHSFVVISDSGQYISYFGEFPKEFVWEAIQLMNKSKYQISHIPTPNTPSPASIRR